MIRCVTIAGVLAALPVAALPAQTVTIERERDADGWTATWRLPQPAARLVFEHPAAGFRPRVFTVLTPGYELVREGDRELLRAVGNPVSEIRVRFPVFTDELTREYEFFRQYTDGSVAIYTGHLAARACDSCAMPAYRFVPPDGGAIVIDGQRHRETVTWADTIGRGTYVYIGGIEPIATRDVISIVDPGLPAWLRAQAESALPRLFDFYASAFGVRPERRPVVLFDYERSSAPGTSYGGGTLPGLIQLGVEGRDWERESPAAAVHLMHFLAHEAAHVWNGEIVHYEGVEDAWMHEGSADALAQRALLALGVIDSAQFRDYQSQALNECRAALVQTALRPSVQRGQPRMAYTCGNMIALLTEQPAGLVEHWRALIARARTQNGQYDAEDYLAVWRAAGASDADVAPVMAFVNGTMTPDALVRALHARGVRTEVSTPPPAFAQNLVRTAFIEVMRGDCGRVGFRISAEGLRLDDNVTCRNLPAGGVVVALGGEPVSERGHLAYDRVRAACAAAAPLTVTMATGATAQVTCTATLPPRLDYIAVLSLR